MRAPELSLNRPWADADLNKALLTPIWRFPADMVGDNASPPLLNHSAVTEHWWEFADGKTSQLFWDIERPPLWTRGSIETVLRYSGDVSSTNTFRIRVVQTLYKVGSNILTKPADSNVTYTIPGPAAAGDELSFVVPNLLSITAEWERVSYSMARNGTAALDTNTGKFMLFAVEHVYYPNR